MKFFDLDIDEYCKFHRPTIRRILDCIDSELRMRGCGDCLADHFQIDVTDNSIENIRNLLLILKSMYLDGNVPKSSAVYSYQQEDIDKLWEKYKQLFKKIYRKDRIFDDITYEYYDNLGQLLARVTHITYPAAYTDVDYFTNEDPLPLDIIEGLHKNGLLIKDIEEQTEEYCRAALSNRGMALQFIKNKTPEFCWQAVGMDGDALQFCPTQTEELCLRAVRQKGLALRWVVKQTPLICTQAIENDVNALQYINNPTPEMQRYALTLHGKALQYIDNQTEELCLIAVKSWGMALQYAKVQTPQMCIAAIKQHYEAINLVKPEMLKKIQSFLNTKSMIRYLETIELLEDRNKKPYS